MALWPYVVAHAVPPGRVELNPKLLAPIFGCSPEEIKEGIAKLCAPDPESRTKDEEGRRLVYLGGFMYRVVTWGHYRERRNLEERREYKRLKQREYRSCGQRMSTTVHTSPQNPPVDSVDRGGPKQKQKQKQGTCTSSSLRSEEVLSGSVRTGRSSPVLRKQAGELLRYLNRKAQRQFRESEVSLGFIAARLKEKDVTVEGCKAMIDRQCGMWLEDSKMCEYLRPQTLFNKTKFDAYYASRELPIPEPEPADHTQRADQMRHRAAMAREAENTRRQVESWENES